jgi:hypothetical protein
MTWIWNSWEEYESFVHPKEVPRGLFVESRLATRLGVVQFVLSAVDELEKSVAGLRALGFGGNGKGLVRNSAKVGQARDFAMRAIRAGEELLLFNMRFAFNDASSGFLHQNALLEHWDRYSQNQRIFYEVEHFTDDLAAFLAGYHRAVKEDEDFIVRDLDLPSELESNFRLARDLFSVGFDEPGLFAAGKGLEGVLRQIAHVRKIKIETKGKSAPASEADFHDLIEVVSMLRWKVRGEPLMAKQTKALLHYLRTVRNSQAHPTLSRKRFDNARDTARLVAITGSALWREVADSRAKLEPLIVPKTW